MTIEFHCPFCQKLLRTADDKAGVRANCPGCGEAVTVPSPGDEVLLGGPPSAVAEAAASNPVPPRAGLLPPVEMPAGSGAVGAATKTCPMCGGQLLGTATRCRHCGEELAARTSRRGGLAPHRGPMILAFGIIGLVMLVVSVFCLPLGMIALPLGVIAWVLGNSDLREIAAGRMEREGEGLTQGGRILGIITCCLTLLLGLIFVVFFGVVILGNLPH